MSHIYTPLHLTFSGIILYNIIPRRKEVTMEWWQIISVAVILIAAIVIAILAMTMAPPLSFVVLGVAVVIFLGDIGWWTWVGLTTPPPPLPPPSPTNIPTSTAGWEAQEPAATPTPRGCFWVSSRVYAEEHPDKAPFADRWGNILHPEWGEEPVPCQPGGNSPYPPYCYCGP